MPSQPRIGGGTRRSFIGLGTRLSATRTAEVLAELEWLLAEPCDDPGTLARAITPCVAKVTGHGCAIRLRAGQGFTFGAAIGRDPDPAVDAALASLSEPIPGRRPCSGRVRIGVRPRGYRLADTPATSRFSHVASSGTRTAP